MSLPQRDALRHTFGESLTWNDGARAEILSAATASHVQIVKLPAYERAGVREAWFVHPTDRHSKRLSARRGTLRTPPGS